MMTDLKIKFEKAVTDAQKLPHRPNNDTLLRIYGLYKQSTLGDVRGQRPGFTDLVGRAKYDAWAKQKGLSAEDAMQKYIELIESLK